MPAKSGRKLQILRGDDASPEVFTRVSGAREESFTINQELIDITDKSDGGWRTYLEDEVGLSSVSISVSGVLPDDTLINDVLGKLARGYQIDIDGIGVFEGRFMIPSLEESGAHNNEITYSLTLESTGEVTYSADA